jgi:hypothetical protein
VFVSICFGNLIVFSGMTGGPPPYTTPVFLQLSSTLWGNSLLIVAPWLNFSVQLAKMAFTVINGPMNNNAPMRFGFSQFLDISELPSVIDAYKVIGSPFWNSWRADSPGIVLFFFSVSSIPIFLVLAWYFNQALMNEEGWSLPWFA